MKPFYSWCACHREIGQTDGAVLLIGGMAIRRPVTLWCACGTATYWRPMRTREEGAADPMRFNYRPSIDKSYSS